jgi:hypothetical protein
VKRSCDMDDEFVVHAALVEWFRRFRRDGVVFFHPSSGEERTKRVHPKTGKVFCPGGTRLQRMGMRKGVPDLVILRSGRIMGLEVNKKNFESSGNGRAGSMPWPGRWKKEGRCWKSGEWPRAARTGRGYATRQYGEVNSHAPSKTRAKTKVKRRRWITCRNVG